MRFRLGVLGTTPAAVDGFEAQTTNIAHTTIFCYARRTITPISVSEEHSVRLESP